MTVTGSCHTDTGNVADEQSNTCFRIVKDDKDWLGARAACEQKGERLAVLEPVKKAQFLIDFMLGNSGRLADNAVKAVEQFFFCNGPEMTR